MKKYFFLGMISAATLVFANCHTSKQSTTTIPKLTYESDMKAVLTTNCSPCHYPDKGGNKKPFDNYANVKTEIDEMIRRIQLNPTERGFMPFKRPKLSDSTIAIFKQYRADGVLER